MSDNFSSEDNNVTKFLRSIHSTTTPNECAALYDKCAETYDTDVVHAEVDYAGPGMTAMHAAMTVGNLSGRRILDAGCGTGLVGVALADYMAEDIDGIDISLGMLNEARKTGVYRQLSIADLTKPIDKSDNSYDIITCCGTFTAGHVGPDPAFKEFVRIVKPGGLIVATVTEAVWVSGGFQAEIERLASDGAVTIVSTEKDQYRRGTNSLAHIVVLRRHEGQKDRSVDEMS